MAPAMAPAVAPAAATAPEDMSDDEDDSPITDSCGKPVPTQYEAFVDVSRSGHHAAHMSSAQSCLPAWLLQSDYS